MQSPDFGSKGARSARSSRLRPMNSALPGQNLLQGVITVKRIRPTMLLLFTGILIVLVFFGAQLKVPTASAYPSYATFNTATPTANTCARSGCHTGTISPTGAVITFPSGMTSYTPGGPAIPLTITVPGTTYQTWGYQLNARMASNLAGAGGFFTAGDNGTTSGFGPSSTFTLNWTPPPAGTTDSVNFYLTGNNTSSFSGSNLFSTGMYTLTPAAAALAPSISTQPANQTMTAGQTATFSVAATGTAPLGYQWRKNGANMSGATSSSYTTPATTTADSNSTFSVVVTNSAGTATSNNATLTVNTATAAAAPSITTQPASRTVTAGQTASFSVAATGTTPLTYQWSKNGVAISGAMSSGYTTPATTTSDTGSLFSVVVTNAAGSATSNSATLTVNSTITTSPMVVSPTSLTFNYQSGGSTSGTQSLTITSSGGRYYYWVSTSGGTWLTASPTSGRTPGTITVSVNASGMSSGTYSGTIQVRADDV